jgi:Prokaryotic metallothionein
LLARVLLFIALAYIFYLALKAYWFARKPSRDSGFMDNRKVDEMVFDPQCQTYLPKGEAIRQDGNYFCSRECAKLFLSR